MPSISFQPVLKDVREILGSGFYEIPRFQRPYSWTSENLEDFWRDVVLDNEPGYFIGPMVSYDSGELRSNIVDGQQRLTSITLALSALRDLLRDFQSTGLAERVHEYVETRDDDNQMRFILRSQGEPDFLSSQFLVYPARADKDPANEEQRNLRKAFEDIRAWLTEQVEGLSTEPPESGEGESEAVERLREIRDRILRLQVIWIQLDNEDDAYIVFETLNSRGKDLEVIDLLKNLLLQYVRAENGDLDTARTRWRDMRRTLEEQGGNINPNKFILHWWLSQGDYTAERKLFRIIKQTVKRAEAGAKIETLANDSGLYARIANPSGWRCGKVHYALRDSLVALNVFGVSQPRPLLLSLLRSLESKQLKPGRAKAVARSLESFHFISTAVVGVSSTGGVSVMYAKHARDLTQARGDKTRLDTLNKLIGKLVDSKRLPPRDTFISEFPRALRVSEDETKSKRLVQYALRKLHDGARPGTALDHGKCTIEHLAPQSEPKEWTAEIGNLLWVDEALNQKLSNKSFEAKKDILAKYKDIYDVDDILEAEVWDAKTVRTRSKRLAELGYDTVWRVQS